MLFEGCKEEWVVGLEEVCSWKVVEQGLEVDAMGGSGGNDPSWQLFDNLMGFDFSGLLK